MSRLLIFKEGTGAGLFEPLDLIRPSFMLHDGAFTNAERWIALVKPDIVLFESREYLTASVAEATGWKGFKQRVSSASQEVWTIEGMAQPLPDKRWNGLAFGDFVWNDRTSRVTRQGSGQAKGRTKTADLPLRGLNGSWDVIQNLPSQLIFDFALWKRVRKSARHRAHAPSKGMFIIGDSKLLWCGKNVQIDPQNVFNTAAGPIIIDDDVSIEPFNRIDGPAFIGRGSTLLGGKFTSGTAIGPGCKIGGEWEASVAHGFVNKAHAGFFGHGYLGEWVNLGALTTNSDLKNNYGTVRVDRAGQSVDTGQIKVGSFIADHAKTGIGTLIPTGANWGVGVNYFGGGTGPKTLPSFTWGGSEGLTEHRLDGMLATAEAAMTRRSGLLAKLGRPATLTAAQRDVLSAIFSQSRSSRATILSVRF